VAQITQPLGPRIPASTFHTELPVELRMFVSVLKYDQILVSPILLIFVNVVYFSAFRKTMA
jgi:hypothetical protein